MAEAAVPQFISLGTNGLVRYGSVADQPLTESSWERSSRERFWRSIGKKVRKGARI